MENSQRGTFVKELDVKTSADLDMDYIIGSVYRNTALSPNWQHWEFKLL